MRISTVTVEALMAVSGTKSHQTTFRGSKGRSSVRGGIVEGPSGPKNHNREPVVPADPDNAAPKRQKRYTIKLAHPGYIIEVCPACGFPEAEGSFCPECLWTGPCNCAYCRRRR